MSNEPISAEQMSYEQAFAELENIIQRLENEQPSLEEALQLYERGQALVQRCAALLDQAELRVKQVAAGDLNGLEEQED
jgi:exodeoxyribonuclease VII small subunit